MVRSRWWPRIYCHYQVSSRRGVFERRKGPFLANRWLILASRFSALPKANVKSIGRHNRWTNRNLQKLGKHIVSSNRDTSDSIPKFHRYWPLSFRRYREITETVSLTWHNVIRGLPIASSFKSISGAVTSDSHRKKSGTIKTIER